MGGIYTWTSLSCPYKVCLKIHTLPYQERFTRCIRPCYTAELYNSDPMAREQVTKFAVVELSSLTLRILPQLHLCFPAEPLRSCLTASAMCCTHFCLFELTTLCWISRMWSDIPWRICFVPVASKIKGLHAVSTYWHCPRRKKSIIPCIHPITKLII